MFATLIESGAGRKAHLRWLSASAVVHLALLAPAVMYSRSPNHDGIVDIREIPHVVWVAPRPTASASGTSRGASGVRAAGAPLGPAMPHLDPVPLIELQDVPIAGSGTGMESMPAGAVTTVPGSGGYSTGSSGSINGPRWAAQVEKVALPLPGNSVPAYPGALRSAGMEGGVTLRFVIDTAGAVERGSAVVIRSDHELFASAALRALATHRFLPAEVGGMKVRMLVEQRFEFAIGKGRD